MNEQPNIIFIMTDQHRLSALGAYGETPCALFLRQMNLFAKIKQ